MSGLAFARDGRLAVSYPDRKTELFDVSVEGEARTALTLLGHEKSLNGLAFSSDGRRLATTSADGTAKVWDVSPGGEDYLTISKFSQEFMREVNQVIFARNGEVLASGSADSKAHTWDPRTGNLMVEFLGHHGPVNGIAADREGTRLATASADSTAKLWDLASGRELLTLSWPSQRSQ